MPSFKMKIASDNSEDIFEVKFNDNEFDLIKEFQEEVSKMLNLDVFKKKFNVSWNIEAEVGQAPIIKTSFPPKEDVIVLLHSIRPFILQKERFYLIKIINILSKNIDNINIKKMVEYNKDLFVGKNSQRIVKVTTNDVVVNSEMFLMNYLNAFEYHRDKDKIDFFKDLFQYFPEEIGRFFVVSLIIDKELAIKNIAKVCGLIIGKVKTLEFRN